MNFQIAGHPGTVQVSLDSPTAVKKYTDAEAHFYQSLGPHLSADFVGKWTPAFFGTLQVKGRLGASGHIESLAAEDTLDVPEQAIVLENLVYKYKRPCVMDVKLGTQLYEDTAPADKIQRMREAAISTTSAQTGIRIAAMKVWDGTKYIDYDKTYGKQLKAHELPAAIAHFFPKKAPWPQHFDIGDTNPTWLLEPVVKMILNDIKSLYEETSGFFWRIRGSSVLIVYEGDPDTAIAQFDKLAYASDSDSDSDTAKDGKDDGQLSMQDQLAALDKGSDAGSDSSEEEDRPRISEMRLIDFGHVSLAQDPDQGFLLGLETLIRLLEDWFN